MSHTSSLFSPTGTTVPRMITVGMTVPVGSVTNERAAQFQKKHHDSRDSVYLREHWRPIHAFMENRLALLADRRRAVPTLENHVPRCRILPARSLCLAEASPAVRFVGTEANHTTCADGRARQ
jgi:hypothetical protein